MHPEQLPTGLSFCTKVDGFDPSKRVVGLKGSQATAPCKAPRRRWASIVTTMNEGTEVAA